MIKGKEGKITEKEDKGRHAKTPLPFPWVSLTSNSILTSKDLEQRLVPFLTYEKEKNK